MTLNARFAAANLDWIVPEWSVAGNVHGFATTRNGGVSFGPAASLDLGPADPASLDEASRAAVIENRRRVASFLPAPPVWLEQVHGDGVASVDATTLDSALACPPVADAALTRLADVPLAVRVADCLPVLFADDAGTVVAAAHAGWRGLAAGVLEATITALQVAPGSLCAWLGPAIGPQAFEVGADVRDAFCDADRGAVLHFITLREGKWLADLPALARRRLAGAGVDRLTGGTHCTYSDLSRFHSYRRDQAAGRMAAFVWRSNR